MSAIVERLAEYYSRHYPDRGNLVICEVKEITMGWETELYSFNAEFKEGGRLVKEERVVRLYHGTYAAQKAAKEFKVMTTLSGAGYPVPEVFHLEMDDSTLGKPFIVMERIRGRNMTEDFLEGSQEERAYLMSLFMKLFVDLHDLDGASLFPGDYFEGNTVGYVNRLLDGGVRDVEHHGIGWLSPVVEWLDDRKAGVSREKLSIIHRDFHPDNIMIREDGSPVVIDWGAAEAGDYRADLAWTILLLSTYWDPAVGEVILNKYQEVSGREVRDFEFFEVLAIFRRLRDVSVSLTSGAEEMGMRPAAVEKMRQDSEHLHRVYGLLRGKTGLRIPEFEKLLNALKTD